MMNNPKKDLYSKVIKKLTKIGICTKIYLTLECIKIVSIYLIILVYLIIGDGKKCFDHEGDSTSCTSSYIFSRDFSLLLFLTVTFLNTCEGIYTDNLYELYSGMVSSLCFCSYSVFRFLLPYNNDWGDFLLLFLSCSFQITYLAIAYPIYKEFSWRYFRKLGSDPFLRQLYKGYLQFSTLLRFDFLFVFVNLVLSITELEFSSPLVEVPFMLLMSLSYIAFYMCGYHGVRYEYKSIIPPFFIFGMIGPTFIIFLFLETWINLPTQWDILTVCTFCTASISFIVRFQLLGQAWICYQNFGKGFQIRKMRKKKKEEFITNENVGTNEQLTVQDVIQNTYALADVYIKL